MPNNKIYFKFRCDCLSLSINQRCREQTSCMVHACGIKHTMQVSSSKFIAKLNMLTNLLTRSLTCFAQTCVVLLHTSKFCVKVLIVLVYVLYASYYQCRQPIQICTNASVHAICELIESVHVACAFVHVNPRQ